MFKKDGSAMVVGSQRPRFHHGVFQFLRVRHVVRRGHYRTFRVPGYHDHRAVKVWIPARRSMQGLDRYGERRTHRVSHIGRRR